MKFLGSLSNEMENIREIRMTEDELTKTRLSEMDKWPEEKRQEFGAMLQQILAEKPDDPSEMENWADEGKKKFLKAFGIMPD